MLWTEPRYQPMTASTKDSIAQAMSPKWIAGHVAQISLRKANTTMANPQIVATGADSHIDFVRRIAAGTDYTVREAAGIADFLDITRDNPCEVLIVDHASAEVGTDDLLTIVRETCGECMTIFRVPATSVADVAQLIRLGAYWCIDEQTPENEVLRIVEQAIEEVESRRSSREPRNQGCAGRRWARVPGCRKWRALSIWSPCGAARC